MPDRGCPPPFPSKNQSRTSDDCRSCANCGPWGPALYTAGIKCWRKATLSDERQESVKPSISDVRSSSCTGNRFLMSSSRELKDAYAAPSAWRMHDREGIATAKHSQTSLGSSAARATARPLQGRVDSCHHRTGSRDTGGREAETDKGLELIRLLVLDALSHSRRLGGNTDIHPASMGGPGVYGREWGGLLRSLSRIQEAATECRDASIRHRVLNFYLAITIQLLHERNFQRPATFQPRWAGSGEICRPARLHQDRGLWMIGTTS